MKKLKFVGLFVLFALASMPSYAAELKIGVVNAGLVMDQSPQKTKALARLEKEFASRSKEIESKHKSLRSKQERLNKDSAILGAEERKNQERELLADQREIKRLQDEYSEDLSIRRNEELRKLEKEIAQTIVDIAQKESYDLIVYQGVIYASTQVDITDKVLSVLKSKSK